jgi:hypothetical protein
LFHDKDYAGRSGDSMFDLSERRFEVLWEGPFFKYGLGESAAQLNSFKLGAFISHTPDYVAAFNATGQPMLVEIQGTGGHDLPYVHKFKKRKLDALGEWDRKNPVVFWLWNEQTMHAILISYKAVRMAIMQGKATEGTFDGFRPYWGLDEPLLESIEDSNELQKRFS